MEFKKILIVRLSSMGDIILSTPLLRAIKQAYPKAIIDFAIKKEFALLMKYNPQINELIMVDTEDMETSRKKIRDAKYDWIIDIQKSSRASQLLSGAGAGLMTTYHKDRFNRFLLINFKWNRFTNIKPVYKRYFEAVEKFNIEADAEGTEIFFSAEEEKSVDQMLQQYGLGSGIPFVTLCPGAKHATKEWTKDGYTELAKRLIEKYHCPIVLLGGPGDEKRCEEIRSDIPINCINLAGKLNLLESAALLKKTKLAVTNDSGLMHLAQSQKTPVVAIYGPTVREFGFYPLEKQSTVIETTISCRPCSKMGSNVCPKGHHKCMKDISVEKVFEATHNYLS